MINELLLDFKNDRNNISLFLEIVKYYRFNNRFIDAENFINENEQFKNDDRVRFELANICFCVDKKDMAIELFEKLLSSKTINISNVVFELIKLYKQKQEYQKAIDAIDVALKKEPKNKELYLQKIIFQRFVPDGKSAIDTIKQFKENIQYTESNKLIKNIETVEKTRRQIAPYRCFFTWGMHYNCNYNCAYCYAPKPQDITFENNQNMKN